MQKEIGENPYVKCSRRVAVGGLWLAATGLVIGNTCDKINPPERKTPLTSTPQPNRH